MAHSFGAVLATGTTRFSGPFSYVVLVVDQLDTSDVKVNEEELGSTKLIQCHEPLLVGIRTGRLVVLAFAFHKMPVSPHGS